MADGDKFDQAELEEAMINYSREPFRKALSDYLQGNPSVDEIKAFAKKYPDRHAQSCSIFARLAGYSEKTEVDVSVTLRLSQMSDSELIRRIAELEKQRPWQKAIDVTPETPEQPKPAKSKERKAQP